MKRLIFFAWCLLLVLPGLTTAKTVYDIDLPETATVSGEVLQLNGYGLRKKFFFKVYLGSLYTAQKVTTADQVLSMPGAKLIRMDFIYSKVEREKITEAFAEGFEKNSPQLKGNPELQQFLDLFDAVFVAGDRVDLMIAADGTVAVTHNERNLGEITSPQLAKAVLLIYLGDDPADDNLKAGMLGAL
jgi:hypothetical protein